MSLLFIVKSTIKNKKRFYEIEEQFRASGLLEKIEIRETQHAGHAIDLAIEGAEEAFRYIIAVGGDGTMNEVLNGVLLAGEQGHTIPVLGMLPFGSANDLSRTLKISREPAELIKRIEQEKIRSLDIGKAVFVDEDGKEHLRYFLNVLDGGIGAIVVKKVNASNKPFGAKITFLRAILSTFLTYTPTEVVCKLDDHIIEDKMLTLVVANGNYFGNGMCIAPDAKVDDGVFSVVCITDISTKDYLLNIRKLFKGEKVDHPKISYHKAREVEIFPRQYSCAVELDGEFAGYSPLKVTMLHHKINFLAG